MKKNVDVMLGNLESSLLGLIEMSDKTYTEISDAMGVENIMIWIKGGLVRQLKIESMFRFIDACGFTAELTFKDGDKTLKVKRRTPRRVTIADRVHPTVIKREYDPKKGRVIDDE